MKRIFLALPFVLFSCQMNNQSNKSETMKLTPEDSIKEVQKKLIEKEKQDSLARVDSIKKSYESRAWKIDQFVDDFGEKKGDKYLFTLSDGQFSNSATSDSYLGVKILVEKKDAGIFLHEYSYDRPAAKFIGSGKIRMKNQDDKELTIFSYSEWNQKGGLLVTGSDFNKLKKFLIESKGLIKVAISDEYSSSYQFNIDANWFDVEYKNI